jgi:hypothetical protein
MPPKPTSLRAYARLRGVSPEAVSKAVMSGRLKESVVIVGGQPKIGDVGLADREWEANTQPRADLPLPSSSPKPPDDEAPPAPGVPPYNVSRAIREAAAARRENALADMAEIERDELRGELVSVDEARATVIDKFTVVKTKILGVPTRVAQRLPQFAVEVVPVVDELLREALEELAAERDDGEEEGEAT